MEYLLIMEYDFSYLDLETMVNRWNEKAEKYNDGSLNDIFDEFITRYIILASYSGILRKNAENKNDSHVCTKEVYLLLQERSLDICQKLLQHANSICDAIANLKFDVRCSSKLRKSIKTNGCFLEPLLRVLYGIRCNLFHGRKQCIANQSKLLIPSISCLKIINQEAMDEMRRIYVNQF